MKKPLLLFLLLSTLLLLDSCRNVETSVGGNSVEGNTVIHTVTFHSGGERIVPSQSVESGGKISRPVDNPLRSGYNFVNWYSDASFQTVYDFTKPVTRDIILYARWLWIEKDLRRIISTGVIPADLSEYDSLAQTVLAPYAAGAAVVAKYVASSAQGTGDASSWDNAAGDIKATMDDITGADADTVYLVLLASGEHTPTDTLEMKNHAAIVGGWNKWEQTGTSIVSGDNTRRVFENNNINRTALLYGITIADGNSDNGGGMYNDNSLPTLISVTFVNNKAKDGGGMYNTNSSSPTLHNVTFVENEASNAGGGMVNIDSSPTLSNVTFANNETKVQTGGGMLNITSSPTLINVTFAGNEANTYGGGMLNNNNGGSGPTIVNTLFWNNKGSTPQVTNGQQIYMWNDGNGAENIRISFSLVQHGITTTNASADDDTADGLGIVGSSAFVVVTQANNISDDPKLAAYLADNSGFVQTIALRANSPAANAGAYIQRSGTAGSFTFYYSADNTSWFSDAVLSASASIDAAAIPADALDLTATDARGYTRNGRPDIGAYEYGGTAP